MRKANHVRRRGAASQPKRQLKKAVRKVVVRRWFLIAVFKAVVWIIKRLWFDKDRTDLSP